MLCPYCQQQHPKGAKFCPVTGEPILKSKNIPSCAYCRNYWNNLPSDCFDIISFTNANFPIPQEITNIFSGSTSVAADPMDTFSTELVPTGQGEGIFAPQSPSYQMTLTSQAAVLPFTLPSATNYPVIHQLRSLPLIKGANRQRMYHQPNQIQIRGILDRLTLSREWSIYRAVVFPWVPLKRI